MIVEMRILFLLAFAISAHAQIQLTPIYRSAPAKPPFELMAPGPYQLCWDIDLSPYAGGEDLLIVTRAIEKGETYMLSRTPMAYSKNMAARTWRLSELFLLWLPLNYLATVVQHEVFGHGYRIRDINGGRVKVSGYSIEMPIPYGFGGGATYYKIGSNLTTSQESAIAMAGVESTAILAQLTKWKWLETGRIDPRQSLLYLLSQHDLNLYIGSLDSNDEDLSGHDINSYLETLNQTYPENTLSKGRLRSLSWINLGDPFTFYALYSWFHYLSSGKETKIPMIASCYLPGLRLGLTPFGPEVFLENYLLYKKRLLYFYVKGGDHADNKYLGLGGFVPHALSLDRWSFGLRIDLWRQPKLLLSPGAVPFLDIDFTARPDPRNPLYPSSEQHEIRYGGAGSLLVWFRGSPVWGFESELGYKAQGFLPGYSLYAAPTARLAFTLAF